ncbi:MAG: M42 family metallopeptidase [Nitrososphaerota archaeon]|nr:M42 family metallopeptidase [Candidatus Bathyarchaeota archaeon]MDW8023911.1 M42 family metallopeptidase [Nitrososphaerota archaeon]
MTLVQTLEKLSNACGVAGREEEVKHLMRELLKPYVDEVKEDKLGNVIGVKEGGKNALKIMLAAHMDEIGLLVKTISKEGFLQFTKMGGIDDRILLAQKVIVHTEKGPLYGIVGSKPPHIQKEEERKKVIAYDELFIDIGAESQEEARQMGVKIGDPVSFDIKFTRAGKDAVIGKAFDDRVGCAVMIETMKQLEDLKCTVYAVGTVQEELGLRGAATAAFGIYPDVGIALDVTVAGDVPGVKEVEAPVKMRKGPSITVADYGLVTHPKVLRLLVDVAEENNIPYQLETGLLGSTDAARISLTREGVPSGVISTPTRYIHSPASLLSLKDAENTVKLTVAAINKIPEHF